MDWTADNKVLSLFTQCVCVCLFWSSDFTPLQSNSGGAGTTSCPITLSPTTWWWWLCEVFCSLCNAVYRFCTTVPSVMSQRVWTFLLSKVGSHTLQPGFVLFQTCSTQGQQDTSVLAGRCKQRAKYAQVIGRTENVSRIMKHNDRSITFSFCSMKNVAGLNTLIFYWLE